MGARERSLLIASSILITGCISDQAVPCGDLLCPRGDVCVANMRCATEDNAAACFDQPDGTLCTSNTVTHGACTGQVCHAIVCGDNLVDPGEVCDDGNTVGGDGCSATCDSTELCGNGIVDAVKGEECDDGVPGVSNDGCSSRCAVELDAWHDISPAPVTARTQHAIAYDAARQRIVLFGGRTELGRVGDTWEWDGVAWHERFPARAPLPREGHTMAYDRARAKTLLFGGASDSGVTDETWQWDGQDWSLLHPATTPPARTGESMAYDTGRDRIVMTGGVDAVGTSLTDTWEWNGSDWKLRPAIAPSGIYFDPMAYDPGRARLVLNVGVSQQTFTWDGTSWVVLATTTLPTNRFTTMAYDSGTGRNVMVMFGGIAGGVPTADTWELGASDWVKRSPASKPDPRYVSTVAYDEHLQKTVMFAGLGGTISLGTPKGDTWLWNGTTWAQPAPVLLAPDPRHDLAMAYDAARGRAVLFGGQAASAFNDTWEWDGAAWTQRTPANAPSPRQRHAMAYDDLRERVMLFGGANGGTAQADLWAWDGTNWTQKLPTTVPPLSADPAMAYDSARDRLVVLTNNQTWEWDGTTWAQRIVAVAPPPRTGAAMTYDRARGKIVLFGGAISVLTELGDTWEWDGTTWVERTPASGPAPRGNSMMTYDPVRRRVVLVGGAGNGSLGDTWEWDGTSWTSRVGGLSARSGAGIVYDEVGRELLIFGGDGPFDRLDDTWSSRFDSHQAEERCLLATADEDGDGFVGCADPDCWGRCAPLCPPGTSCAAGSPTCGDGTCDPVEDHELCPADCP